MTNKTKRFPLEIDGVIYQSVKEISDKHDIQIPTLYRRLSKGVSGAALLQPPQKNKKSNLITICGVTYPSFSAAAKAVGVSFYLLRTRYKNGLRDEDLIKPSNKKIVIYGKKFPSLNEVSRAYHVSVSTLNYRYDKGLRGEDLLHGKDSKLPKWITFDRQQGEYLYNRTYKGESLSKGSKDLRRIKAISKLVNDYIKLFDKLPDLGNDRIKIDANTILGKQFNELTVLGVMLVDNNRKLYCKCSCGKEVYYQPSDVVSGKLKSCGHLEHWALRDKNAELKEIQRNSNNALVSNKTTGEKYISYNKAKKAYDFEITRGNDSLRRRFKSLDEAIAFKQKSLEAIKNNSGKIPREM